jgi:hypothetical protein
MELEQLLLMLVWVWFGLAALTGMFWIWCVFQAYKMFKEGWDDDDYPGDDGSSDCS